MTDTLDTVNHLGLKENYSVL